MSVLAESMPRSASHAVLLQVWFHLQAVSAGVHPTKQLSPASVGRCPAAGAVSEGLHHAGCEEGAAGGQVGGQGHAHPGVRSRIVAAWGRGQQGDGERQWGCGSREVMGRGAAQQRARKPEFAGSSSSAAAAATAAAAAARQRRHSCTCTQMRSNHLLTARTCGCTDSHPPAASQRSPRWVNQQH